MTLQEIKQSQLRLRAKTFGYHRKILGWVILEQYLFIQNSKLN